MPTVFIKDRSQAESLAANSEEVKIIAGGALSVSTGKCTGRSPQAKYYVNDRVTSEKIDWDLNNTCSESEWDDVFEKVIAYEVSNKTYSQKLYAGKDEKYQIQIHVNTSSAWQALFSNNMFVRERISSEEPMASWDLRCYPEVLDEPRVYINFTKQSILIAGTHYAGEIKKSIFSVLNFLLPDSDVLPMHCSVNTGHGGESPCIFFGLSGTGKTTLSADDSRTLIGDDEHGWSAEGVFNFEGGCYAKVINLSKDAEPQIWDASQKTGAILENVIIDQSGTPDFDDSSLTENTRASYPISSIKNASLNGVCGIPKNVIFLTCDAFGVLPPVSKLSSDQAVQHFLMGYTSKIAGTEEGVTEPQVTFSQCFGAPFMPRNLSVYKELLQKRIKETLVDCWLVNTGWTHGPYGTGYRMPIGLTRQIIAGIHDGTMKNAEYKKHVYTDCMIPVGCEWIPEDILHPEKGWENLEDYKDSAKKLMKMFINCLKQRNI